MNKYGNRASDKATSISGLESDYARTTALGTFQLSAAEVLGLVLGFGISVILTRRLGPALYGLYSVAVTVVLWIELGIHYMFHQATIKFLAEASDWQKTASALVQAGLLVGLAAAALLAMSAPILAAWLKAQELVLYLRLLALDIPLYALASGHKSTLIGRSAFAKGALPGIWYWSARLLLVIMFTGLGLSAPGALLAIVGSSAVQFIVTRFFIRPALLKRASFPLRPILGYALPLFLHGTSLRVLTRLDLLLVQGLGGTAAVAGYYGAAQNLAIVTLGTLASSLSSPLLSTVTKLRQAGQEDAAREMTAQALRLLLCLLPFAALVAGASTEIVQLAYGDFFSPAAPLLSWLIFGGVALLILSVCSALLVAAGKPGVTLILTSPLLPLAVAGHCLLIPRYGSIGAAAVTTVVLGLAALGGVLGACRFWEVHPPLGSAVRSSAISVLAYIVAAFWSTPGFLLVGKLLVIGAAILLAFLLLGGFSAREFALLRSLFTSPRQ
nr:oligosaccharide flippase family protein [Chloroflexota bacterium]